MLHEAREALKELVRLKDAKDRGFHALGQVVEYEREKQAAWARAREFLSKPTPSKGE